jgi:serine phosphatase RsbU (regulator of sigma subunit)
MKRTVFLWLYLIFSLPCGAQAQSLYQKPFEVTDDVPLVFSDKAGTRVLAETDGPLSLEQASARIADFKPAEAIGSIRPREYYWVLSRLQSRLDRDREIRIEMPMWEGFQSHVIFENGSTLALQASGNFWGNYSKLGDTNPYVQALGSAPSQFSVFTLRRGESVTLLTRVRANANFIPGGFVPSFSEHARVLELRRLGLHIEGMQAGILLALGIFGWFSVFQNRDRTSLAYGVWIIFALLSATSLRVHDGSRLFEFYLNIEGNRTGHMMTAAVITNFLAYFQAMCYVIFARNFLELKTNMPRAYQITNVYLVFTLGHLYVVTFAEHSIPQTWLWTPLFSVFLMVLLMIFSCAWHRYRQGLRIAKFFMFAMVPYLFFRVVFFLGILNVPSPFSYLDNYGIGLFMQNSNTAQAMGVCAEAMIMAMAVISKTRWLQQELSQKIQAQKEMVETQNQILESTVAQRTRELVESKAEVEKQHEVVVDSIRYASRLQRAQLPRMQRLEKHFASFHAIWEPRDTIGGDVWWASLPDDQGRIVVAVADSTGHGVPGAMLSVLISTSLERMFASDPSLDPSSALMRLDAALRTGLNQDSDEAESDDGCDAAIVRIDPAHQLIEFAGAKLGLLHLHADGSVQPVKPSRLSLGYRDPPHEIPLLHQIRYESGDGFVIVSDGLTDQIGTRDGGPPRAYGYRRLHELVARHHRQSAAEIAQAMREDLREWQGGQMRRDDVTAVVFKPA